MNFNKKKMKQLLRGLAYGDAIGVTTEFHRGGTEHVYEQFKSQGWPSRAVGKDKWNLEPGDHTDDTDMAWCIVESAYEKGKFNPEDIAYKFVGWLNTNPPDIGNTTHNVLSAIRDGTEWYEAGRNVWIENKNNAANGSLMRNGVICGLTDDLNEAFEMTLLHGMITHYAPLPQLCCAIQTWFIHHFLNGVNKFESNSWMKEFVKEFEDFLYNCQNKYLVKWFEDVHFASPTSESDYEFALKILDHSEWDCKQLNPFTMQIGQSGGYCLITLQIALWAMQWALIDDIFPTPKRMPKAVFEKNGLDCLCWIPLIGYDADTYAATAGPVFTSHFGDLPANKSDNLQINKWIKELYNRQ